MLEFPLPNSYMSMVGGHATWLASLFLQWMSSATGGTRALRPACSMLLSPCSALFGVDTAFIVLHSSSKERAVVTVQALGVQHLGGSLGQDAPPQGRAVAGAAAHLQARAKHSHRLQWPGHSMLSPPVLHTHTEFRLCLTCIATNNSYAQTRMCHVSSLHGGFCTID